MSKELYLMHSCDTWKSKCSMTLLMVTASKFKLKHFVARMIEEQSMTYGSASAHRCKPNGSYPTHAMAKQWKKDFDEKTINELNVYLNLGYIECVHDGEEI